VGVLALLVACHHGGTTKEHEGHGAMQKGIASWYGESQRTASGERFDPGAMTAAHRTLPMGTMVRVTNNRNGRSVVVRINDRGPYGHGRIIDLSRAAARQLGMIDAGTAPVTVEVIGHR
jgi:rare lipoprotein A